MDKDLLLSLARPQDLCMNCNAPLEPIGRHPSVLRVAAGRPERADYCPACWQQLKDDAYDSFWLARREPRTTGPPRLTRRQRSAALRALFESLWERRDVEPVGLHLYLLAHLMMKWGGLYWRASRTDALGREVVEFEDPVGGDRIEVVHEAADEARVLAVQREIEQFLREYAPDHRVDL